MALFRLFLIFSFLVSGYGCDGETPSDSDGDSDGDIDADSDGDGDADSDGDSDADTQEDGDSDDSPPLCPGDEFEPWAGGATYYARWTYGPPSDESFFPIAVWLQNPRNASRYADIGINLFIGLWQGPTQEQLDSLADEGMHVICAQNEIGLTNLDNESIWAWMHGDEPDNAQWNSETESYDPCIPPSEVQNDYAEWTAADSSRPIYLNLGQSVANEGWIGRGDCTGHDEHYPEYVLGADIVSFDIYPVATTDEDVHGHLWYVAHGVERLREFANNEKPVWNWIETTHINNPNARPTSDQVRSEVWMSIIHGSMGIGYFCHEWHPEFAEDGLLRYDDIRQGVREINTEIQTLAPVLNGPSISNGTTVSVSNKDVPVAVMVKRTDEATYLFAVAMRDGLTTATFTPTCVPENASIEVIGEDRTLALNPDSFSDEFSGYQVHLYRILR